MPHASNDHVATRLLVLAAGLSWAANVQFPISEWATMAFAVDYSAWTQDISVLGITRCGPFLSGDAPAPVPVCSPKHMVLNVSLFILGLQVITGAALSRAAWPDGWMTTVGLCLVAASGVGLLLVGVSPLDVARGPHFIGAAMNFCLGGAGFVILGVACRKAAPRRAAFSLLCGATTLIATWLYSAQIYETLGRGGMERLAAYSMTLWFVGTGLSLLAGECRAATVTAQA
ncbi:DUF998 domain-containing protein [Breoghania sp. L-A4]|uniref:DUF998 domain-containing protein n=1 Tax=Breoghania sp. L-A4 TaxID=2304600 RepID=UPI0013C2DC8E|nr:DUF998 domain-containing protein [Breoghania sp. L-A4]